MSKPFGGRPQDVGHWPILLPIGSQKHVPKFPLAGTAYVFGSRPPAHVALKSKLVSKSHVIVINDRGESYLRDLASTNGVYLNNQPVREARLSDGDILNIGRFQFICYSGFPSELDEEPQTADDAELVIDGRERPLPIHLRSLLIGRRPKCEVRLEDAGVSNVHALIYRCDGRRFIRDLNSASGTFLNNQRIRETELRAGDVIRIGETLIHCERATQSQRGGWVPTMAAEEAAPLRLADLDEGPLDPMTDSSLERALLIAEEIEVSAVQEEEPQERNEPAIVESAPASEPAMTGQTPAVTRAEAAPALPCTLDKFAGTLASVEAEGPLEDVFALLRPELFEEGPTARNMDLPAADNDNAARSDSRRHIEMPVQNALTNSADESVADDEEAGDLLDDVFLRKAWESSPPPGTGAAAEKNVERPTSPPAHLRRDPERCENLDFPVEF